MTPIPKHAPRRRIILSGLLLGGLFLVGFHIMTSLPAGQPGTTSGQTGQADRNNDRNNRPTAAKPSASTKSQPITQSPKDSTSATLPQSTERHETTKYVELDGQQYPLRTYRTLATPNDPLANQNWVNLTKMNQAWDTPAGNHDTLLAIIDTGFALKHEELANRWYVNPGESGPASSELASPSNCSAQGKPLTKDCNLIDDDGNGYIDDVSGWDFANNDNSPQAGQVNPAGTGTTHGTKVAGLAAASGNNGKGLAGADWHTKLLPIQALDDNSTGDTLGVGRAIRYAVNRGANVISLSLGSDEPDDYVRQAIKTATAAGIVVVAAAGNTSCDCMVYPAHYPEVLAVGALDTNGQPASFNSYGSALDIMAPGTGITSSSWSSSNQTATYASNLAGTSFATPIVSGLLSRLLSQQPAMTPLQLIAAVTETTNRDAIPTADARTDRLGYGSLDAAAATNRANNPNNPNFTYSFTPVSHGAALNPSSPLEPTANYLVKTCDNGRPGTTPVYEMTKDGNTFYTISQVEQWQAQVSGYQSRLFANACLQQPQDSSGPIRLLNIFKEFRNIYEKL